MSATSDDIFLELAEALYRGDANQVTALTQAALGQGCKAPLVLNQALLAGMQRVGADFKAGKIFIPEVIVAARAMHSGLEVLRPVMSANETSRQGKIILGTVKGDMHDIGKRLVGIMMAGAGFEVIDLGTNVAPEKFAAVAQKEMPDLIGLSALLSTTMPMMKSTLDAISKIPASKSIKVIVGGAPVSKAWADEIGADGYAPDAVSAVETSKALLAQGSQA